MLFGFQTAKPLITLGLREIPHRIVVEFLNKKQDARGWREGKSLVLSRLVRREGFFNECRECEQRTPLHDDWLIIASHFQIPNSLLGAGIFHSSLPIGVSGLFGR